MADADYIVLHRYCHIRTASAGVSITGTVSGQTLTFDGNEVLIDFGDKPEDRPSKISIVNTATVKFLPFKIERL